MKKVGSVQTNRGVCKVVHTYYVCSPHKERSDTKSGTIDSESRQNLLNNDYMMSTDKWLDHEVRLGCVFYKKQGVCVLLTALIIHYLKVDFYLWKMPSYMLANNKAKSKLPSAIARFTSVGEKSVGYIGHMGPIISFIINDI